MALEVRRFEDAESFGEGSDATSCDNCGRWTSRESALERPEGLFCGSDCYWSELLDSDNSRFASSDGRSLSMGSRESESEDANSNSNRSNSSSRRMGSSMIPVNTSIARQKRTSEVDTHAMYMFHESNMSSTYIKPSGRKLIFL
mmetsp:Transcript_10768/g.32966  ORF Transcript_10768/g.32966 Transcript_10768/m.32966 type:complete len:144 (-) Transcript_10768:134-565(-)|eukprot:CAMPEP_0198733730 /NCGR_PEP_ID=MMETSP1475-20131203/47928_1 /TAXON_ID= ORGANISM="Unidentified sp., Strain CCMP1999" /NCGR_SAMPLE_ID=MMETSP1475 /ASSEMBLY_ACC=CAM_ASM_001111 /LENGTH=143 /DNA_ID=CAMNT_0044497077 /DNA_START=151 /DNA_END=582 /DNA_ORIENTATION=-